MVFRVELGGKCMLKENGSSVGKRVRSDERRTQVRGTDIKKIFVAQGYLC